MRRRSNKNKNKTPKKHNAHKKRKSIRTHRTLRQFGTDKVFNPGNVPQQIISYAEQLVSNIPKEKQPLAIAAIFDFFAYPETLSYVMAKYKYPTKPTLDIIQKIIFKNANWNLVTVVTLGLWFVSPKPDTFTEISEFEKKWTTTQYLEIKTIPMLLNTYTYMFLDKIYYPLIPVLHSSLINHFLHPETLEYVMKMYFPGKEKPSLIGKNLEFFIISSVILTGLGMVGGSVYFATKEK